MNLPARFDRIERYETSGGGQVFQIPLLAFPDFWVNAYLVLVDGNRILIDCGSGYGESDQMLEDGLKEAAELSGQPVSLENLTYILITHAHIDHFGGLVSLANRTPARIGVHELDLPVLTHYGDHLEKTAARLSEFLIEAGVPTRLRQELDEMYRRMGTFYRSVRVDFSFQGSQGRVEPFTYLHTPGHAAGHVVFRLHDVLFGGDHVLAEISPHQAPAVLRPHTGLRHYLNSLEQLLAWSSDASVLLCGHDGPIYDLAARVEDIRALHRQRLEQVLSFLEEPHTIAQVAAHLFDQVEGYNWLLALEEAGAHVEYLQQESLVSLEQVASAEGPAESLGLWYRSREEGDRAHIAAQIGAK